MHIKQRSGHSAEPRLRWPPTPTLIGIKREEPRHGQTRSIMIQHPSTVLLAIGMLVTAASAQAEPRGELLYSTHCIACHTAQVHWRDRKLATDWNGLVAQVRRWQATGMLGWSEDDILDVTRYLNDHYYRFASPSGPTAALEGMNSRRKLVPNDSEGSVRYTTPPASPPLPAPPARR